MRPIPATIREDLASDPFYERCARKSKECKGRITWEHAIIFAGRQLNEKWAILPICAYHHAVNEFQDKGDLKKEIHVWIALNRATDAELRKISKATDYFLMRKYLNSKYGIPKSA